MTLDSSELVAGNVIEAGHVLQFYNLFTGVMTDQVVLFKNKLTLTRVAAAGPTPAPYLLVTGVADTTVSGEVQDVYFNLARTVQIAGGSIPAANRSVYIAAPTLASSSAQTLALASTLAISGPPVAGTNLTLTKALAFQLETGDLQVTTGDAYFGNDVYFGTATSVPKITAGSANPESNETAPTGSLYLRTNGTLYRKGSGTGNTGWIALTGMSINARYSGSISMANGVSSATATITAVTTANSDLSHLGQREGSGAPTDNSMLQTLTLTNTTTITAERGDATDAVVVNYQLIEWA